MCCRGCQAVASLIADSGLTDFYRYRTEKSPLIEERIAGKLNELELYDRDDLQKNFLCGRPVKSVKRP